MAQHRAVTLRGVPTRGAKVPAIRGAVAGWAAGFIGGTRAVDCRALALELISEPVIDDKLAGVLFAAESCVGAVVDAGLALFEVANAVAEKLLAPLLHLPSGGGGGARRDAAVHVLLRWCAQTAVSPWRARAAVMAFAPSMYAKDVRLRGPIWIACSAVLSAGRTEAGMAVGTVLRSVSKPGGEDETGESGVMFVNRLLQDDVLLSGFDRESLAKAIVHFGKEQRDDVRRRFKATAILGGLTGGVGGGEGGASGEGSGGAGCGPTESGGSGIAARAVLPTVGGSHGVARTGAGTGADVDRGEEGDDLVPF
jgi:hypothetical protein